MKAQSLSAQCLSVCAAVCLFAAAITFTSCNQNTPDDTKKGGDSTTSHQPANPATWSPVGKIYTRDRSTNNAYGYDYFIEVVTFYTKDSAVWYGTIHSDLTPMDDYYNPASYKLNYPALTFTFGIDKDEYHFTDTLTLYCNTSDNGAYTLLDTNNLR